QPAQQTEQDKSETIEYAVGGCDGWDGEPILPGLLADYVQGGERHPGKYGHACEAQKDSCGTDVEPEGEPQLDCGQDGHDRRERDCGNSSECGRKRETCGYNKGQKNDEEGRIAQAWNSKSARARSLEQTGGDKRRAESTIVKMHGGQQKDRLLETKAPQSEA